MSICPQCGKTVQAGVVLCPYCKVNMHTLRRSELSRREPGHQELRRTAPHRGPARESDPRSSGEKRPGPDGLSIGRLTGVLLTSRDLT